MALFACSDGTALTIRNSAISAIALMIVAPAANAREPKIRSPHRPPPRSPEGDFPNPGEPNGFPVVIIEVCPPHGAPGGVPRLGSGVIVMALGCHDGVTQEIAVIAVANLPLKESGTGM